MNEKQVADLTAAKVMLTTTEAAALLGISKSCLYKMTMRREVPFYKPMGGKLSYFNRTELESWMMRNRIATDEELSQKAQAYCMKKGGARA